MTDKKQSSLFDVFSTNELTAYNLQGVIFLLESKDVFADGKQRAMLEETALLALYTIHRDIIKESNKYSEEMDCGIRLDHLTR